MVTTQTVSEFKVENLTFVVVQSWKWTFAKVPVEKWAFFMEIYEVLQCRHVSPFIQH
jgi:hypothetical protein